MSFEDTITCSQCTNLYKPECAPPWYTTGGSPDYCSSAYSCPGTIPPGNLPFGFQYPRTGDAHVGIGVFTNSPLYPNYREYFGVELLDTLKGNHIYRTEFYVSLANICRYATDDIGAYFSDTSTANPNGPYSCIPLIPQILNQQGSILGDTLSWMLVSDTFVAQGGEKFMTIGNFFNDSNTTFINTYRTNPFLAAYYFFDDVSVTDITVGIQENNISSLVKIYPNPASEIFTIINFNPQKMKTISIYNTLGAKVKSLPATKTVFIGDLPRGFYFIQVKNDSGISISEKIILE